MYKRGRIGINLGQKKGQLTMFIIIALVIVGVGVLIYFLSPDLRTDDPGFDETNPEAFMQTCLEDDLRDTVEIISLQGGSMEPQHNVTLDGVEIMYLCYTNENSKPCTIQQPLLRQHVMSEIEDEIMPLVRECFNSLEESYIERNYEPQLNPGRTYVELIPGRLTLNMNYVLTVRRANVDRYENFRVVLNNNLYELTEIAEDIIEKEVVEVNVDPRRYINLYGVKGLDVRVNNRQDGTSIYTVIDTNTGDKFQFASRSWVLAPGH